MLFPGSSCFPLSPSKNTSKDECSTSENNKILIEENDQVKLILQFLGPQSEVDMSFVTSDHVFSFLKKIQKKGKEELKQSKAEDKRPTLA